jgi:hypothetical protein
MGSRSNDTTYSGSFQTPPETPEEQALKSWQPNQTLLNAGQSASYGAARQGIVEGSGGYSGITNPVLAARQRQIGLQELADKESSAKADAALQNNQLDLQNKQFLAGLRKPQYIQNKMSQQDSLLGSIFSGLGLAASFA